MMNYIEFWIVKTTHAILEYNPLGFNVLFFLQVTKWYLLFN